MAEPAPLPPFVREALEEAAEGAALPSARSASTGMEHPSRATLAREAERALLTLEEASFEAEPLPADTDVGPLQSGRERLARALSEAPLRYAPFYGLVAELFDLSEQAAIAELSRLRERRAWRFAGLPGISQVAVAGGPRVRQAETLFVRFAPGLRFPRHDHTGAEHVLVLEGSYEDSHGVIHRAGELRQWAAGSEHSFRVGGEPCIIASVVFGRRFGAWWLRALSALLGR